MTSVVNLNGYQIDEDFEAAVILMDDELRERLHNLKEWDSEQEFFTAYEIAHRVKFGEDWELSKDNPTW